MERFEARKTGYIIKFLWSALSVALLLLLASCGGQNGSLGQSAGQVHGEAVGQKPAEVPKSEPVDLYFYSTSGNYDTAGFMKVFGEPIKQKFPNVTPKYVEYKKDKATNLETLITSGQTIDILYNSIGQTAQTLFAYNMQYDIGSLIKKYNYDLSKLEPTTVEIQRQIADGGIYGLPFSTSALALFYNKDLFDKFGVPYPKDGMTWEDAYEMTKKMSRTIDGVRYRGMIVSISHTMMLDPLSPAYVDQKTNKALFSTDKFKQAFQTLTDFYHIAGNEVDNSTKSYGTQLALFQKDKTVAMFLGLNSLAAVYFADKDNLNWDVATYPHYKEQPNIGPQTYPNYFYVTQTSKHKDIAFQVIAYMTSEDFQKHLAEQGEYPILKNADIMKNYGKDLSFMQNKHISALLPNKFAAPAFKGDYQSIGSTALTNAYYQVILGQKDVNTALRDADESIDKQIAAQLTK